MSTKPCVPTSSRELLLSAACATPRTSPRRPICPINAASNHPTFGESPESLLVESVTRFLEKCREPGVRLRGDCTYPRDARRPAEAGSERYDTRPVGQRAAAAIRAAPRAPGRGPAGVSNPSPDRHHPAISFRLDPLIIAQYFVQSAVTTSFRTNRAVNPPRMKPCWGRVFISIRGSCSACAS